MNHFWFVYQISIHYRHYFTWIHQKINVSKWHENQFPKYVYMKHAFELLLIGWPFKLYYLWLRVVAGALFMSRRKGVNKKFWKLVNVSYKFFVVNARVHLFVFKWIMVWNPRFCHDLRSNLLFTRVSIVAKSISKRKIVFRSQNHFFCSIFVTYEKRDLL